jgi:hypothetical protein
MKLQLKFGTLAATCINCTVLFWDLVNWIRTSVSVETVASIFRLQDVAVGFPETLIPFKLHNVTTQKTVKLNLLNVIER